MSFQKAAGLHRRLLTEWSRPVLAEERPVYTSLPTFALAVTTPQQTSRASASRLLTPSLA
jgi:hypothetical protein